MLAVGFETTAPAAAAAVLEAERLGLDNFALLTSYFRLAPAVESLLAAPGQPRQRGAGVRARLRRDGTATSSSRWPSGSASRSS